MAQPRGADWLKLKRVARYIVGAPMLIHVLEWHQTRTLLGTYTDSDLAGDRATCKSASGGAVTWGHHTLKTWATSQAVVVLRRNHLHIL